MEEGRAQASGEFLLILAAVSIIALLLVFLLISSTESNYEKRYLESRVYWQNQRPISITDAKAVHNGLILLLKNSGGSRLQLTNISARDEFQEAPNTTAFGNPVQMEPGMRLKIAVPVTYSDTALRNFVSLQMQFRYISQSRNVQAGRELLILPKPNACNEFSEFCTTDLDCCNNAPCSYGSCGGCGGDGQECSETPDCCSGLVCSTGTCRQKPDLVSIQLSPLPPETINPSSSVSMRIANIGPGPAAPSAARLSWSGAGCSPRCEYELEIPQIIPGEAFDFLSPFACQDAHDIVLEADSGSALDELQEGNNILDILVSCPLADMSAHAVPSSPQTVGFPFPVPIITVNNGAAPSGADSATRASFGGGTVDGVAELSIPIPSLDPGGTQTDSVTVLCNSEGTFDLVVMADADFAIAESNEGNNANPYPIECAAIPSRPNLVASIQNPPASIGAQPVNVIVRTSNGGSAPSIPSVTSILYTPSGLTFNGNRFADISVPARNPGQYYDSSPISVACENHDGNTYYINLRADATGANAEGPSGEADNDVQYGVVCSAVCYLDPGDACGNQGNGADPACCTGRCARSVCCYNNGWSVGGDSSLCCSLYAEGGVCRGRRPGTACDFGTDCDSSGCVGGICAQYGPDVSGWNGCRSNAECSTNFCGRQGNAWAPSCCRGPTMSCTLSSDCCGGGSTCSVGACTCKPSGPTRWCFQNSECCSGNCIISGNNGYCG